MGVILISFGLFLVRVGCDLKGHRLLHLFKHQHEAVLEGQKSHLRTEEPEFSVEVLFIKAESYLEEFWLLLPTNFLSLSLG